MNSADLRDWFERLSRVHEDLHAGAPHHGWMSCECELAEVLREMQWQLKVEEAA